MSSLPNITIEDLPWYLIKNKEQPKLDDTIDKKEVTK